MAVHAQVLPIRVDAMMVDDTTRIAEPPAFHRLPYNDGRRDVYAGVTFLAEHVTPAPFEDATAWLPPGVHLHWALPRFLTIGRHNPGRPRSASQARVNGIDFPLLPNRWLVRTPGYDWWMVESDYVHPELTHAGRPGVSYLLDAAQQAHLATTAPFRFVGRQLPLRDWAATGPGDHLPGITAVGWGDPAFHAFYPHCWSILGFHDPDPDPQATGGTYDVYGYYADLTHDPVAELVADNTTLDNSDLRAMIDDQLGCSTPGLEDWPWTRPSRLLVFGAAVPPAPFTPPATLELVTVGAHGSSALATHLATRARQEHHPAAVSLDPGLAEEALEALVLAERIDVSRPDAYAKLREAAHAHSFVGVDGGSRWTVRTKGPGLTADAAHAPPPVHGSAPDDAAALLVELNHTQHALDRLARHQDRLSEQLYADWCLYLTSKYPPRGSTDDYPDPDQVRRHIERNRLARLQANIVDYQRLLATATDLATTVITALHDADLAQLTVTAADISDWDAVADALARIGVSSALPAVDPADTVTWRAAIVDVVNRLIIDDPLPARHALGHAPGASIDDSLAAWLMTPPPTADDVAADSATVSHQIFGRDDDTTDLHRQRWLTQLTELVGRWHRAAQARAGLELLAGGGLKVAAKARHHLEVLPGPRFWAPRDPVVIVEGPAVARSARRPTGTVWSTILPVGDDPATWLPRAVTSDGPAFTDLAAEFRTLARQLPGGNLSDVDRSGRRRTGTSQGPGPGTDQDSWHPVLVDWKAVIHDPAGPVELTGRAHLSGHTTGELLDAISRRPTPTPTSTTGPGPGPAATLAEWANDYLETRNHEHTIQSISLTGFNTAHLMHRSLLPLAVADPHGFPEAQDFAARVAAAIGRHTTMAPDPLGVFRPVRSGPVELASLRAIDAFGRVADLQPTPATVWPFADRVVPPARLHARWLAATPPPGAGATEAGDHPATGPICGWLVPNLLEGRIMVHEASGDAIGSVDETGRWRPAPGTDRYVPPDDIANVGLRHVVLQLLHETATQQGETLTKIQDSLDTIEPDSHAQHRSLSLLVGRPVAVVRLAVRLELLGIPPTDQSWTSFQTQLAGGQPDDAGLLQREFPVRFGEPGQLDDGVVGFWVERGGDAQGNGTPFDGPLYVPQLAAAPATPEDAVTSGSGVIEMSGGHLTLRLDGPTTDLTVLMDPRGTLHATTGILPTTVLDLSHEQVGPALDAISVTFRTSSLLCDPGRIQVALPSEPGYTWSWLERTTAGWEETAGDGIEPPSTRAKLTAQQQVRDGWLKLSPAPPSAEPAISTAGPAGGTGGRSAGGNP